MRLLSSTAAVAASLVLAASASATTYTGNGLSGFNGGVGLGQLQVTDNGTGGLVFSFTPGNGNTNLGGNALVLYLDTKSGGITSTAGLTDEGDQGRRLVSGAKVANPDNGGADSRATEIFSTGFGADYGIEFETGVYAAAFDLSTPSNYTYVGGNSIGSDGPYVVTIDKTALGLPASGAYSFSLVGSQISGSIYRSNETFGVSATTTIGSGLTDNPGFNGTQTFNTPLTFVNAVPEPASLSLLGIAGLAGLRRRRA